VRADSIIVVECGLSNLEIGDPRDITVPRSFLLLLCCGDGRIEPKFSTDDRRLSLCWINCSTRLALRLNRPDKDQFF